MEQLNIIKTLDGLKDLATYLQGKEFISFDCETNGVDKESRIIGISVSAEIDVGFYVILSYWDPNTCDMIDLETHQGMKTLLNQLTGKANLIMHNAVFDCWMTLNNYGVDLMPSVHTDTMILGHLLNESRSNALKELGTAIYGEDAKKEQKEMKESVLLNGGSLTKDKYELYKADADLLAKYGAKDAILTLKLFYEFVPQLFEESLDKFFYEDESMPLLRGPTYDLNTAGLTVDSKALETLRVQLEADCMEAKAFVYKEITPLVSVKYPGTKKTNTFNIGASQQMAWLLFGELKLEFNALTDGGKELCDFLDIKPPYSPSDKRAFIRTCVENKDRTYGAKKKVRDPWAYIQCGKDVLGKYAKRYKWVATLLEYHKNMKLLTTYVGGIQSRMRYNVIRPSFLQIGTTSGRYSSKNPNFQNLPRDDKRIKECIVSRPGHSFVGADYSQLEPRVFASVSQDPTLMECFAKGEDFYSVVGIPIFNANECSSYKDAPNAFAKLHADKRQIAKAFALATPYGTSAWRQSRALGLPQQECQYIIDQYFAAYPLVEQMMLNQHKLAKTNGVVHNLYGRPRRMPEAKNIDKIYGKNTPHGELPYEARNLLNLGMNHAVQSTAASIMNRAAIALWHNLKAVGIEAKIVMQVHDQLILECRDDDVEDVKILLRDAMENSTILPGVKLEAIPFASKDLAGQK